MIARDDEIRRPHQPPVVSSPGSITTTAPSNFSSIATRLPMVAEVVGKVDKGRSHTYTLWICYIWLQQAGHSFHILVGNLTSQQSKIPTNHEIVCAALSASRCLLDPSSSVVRRRGKKGGRTGKGFEPAVHSSLRTREHASCPPLITRISGFQFGAPIEDSRSHPSSQPYGRKPAADDFIYTIIQPTCLGWQP